MKRPTIIVSTALAIALGGAGLGAYLAQRTPSRHHPKILNEPTDARRIRLLKAGAQPGFPLTRPKVEKHEEDD